MKIYSTTSTSFGMKVPVKTAIEAASGMFLREAKIAYPEQVDLLTKLGNLDSRKLYTGEVSEGLRNMRNVIRSRHPELAKAAERIGLECDKINMDRTFLPEDEIIVSSQIAKMLDDEAKKIGTDFIDIDSMSLHDLGLDKYANIQ